VTMDGPWRPGVDRAPADMVVQHAFGGVRWLAPWATVLLLASAVAHCFDLALVNCCPVDGPLRAASLTQTIAASAPKETWQDGALPLPTPDRSAALRGLDGGGCWPPDARSHACSGF
jgi:hypothetical protein